MTVHLDLRKDLPKLQRAMPAILEKIGGLCEYSQPCAVGVMVNPRKRAWLDNPGYGDSQIDTLIRRGMVKVPSREQADDLRTLQIHFDNGEHWELAQVVERLAQKYLPASVDTHPEGGDGTAPALLSGAVGEAETPKPLSQDPSQ